MPRSSRHKSHKQHKNCSRESKGHTDSEEEEVILKGCKVREEIVPGPGIRVLKDSDFGGKRKIKDLPVPGNRDPSEEHGCSKRRKDRGDLAPVLDLCDDREDGRMAITAREDSKDQGLAFDRDKTVKFKMSISSRSKSNKRLESSSEGKGETLPVTTQEEASKGSGRVDPKRKYEKDPNRKESNQYRDAKEKERGGDKDKKLQGGRSEKQVDEPRPSIIGSEASKRPGVRARDEEHHVKLEVKNTERKLQEELRSLDFEKEHEKQNRRRKDISCDKAVLEDGDCSRPSLKEDTMRNGKYKDEKHKEDRYKDKHHGDLKFKVDKHRDERPPKEHTSDRSDGKHSRDEIISESNHRKHQASNFSYSAESDDRCFRNKDNSGRKRSPDGPDDSSNLRSRDTRERVNEERRASRSSKLDFSSSRERSTSHSHHVITVDSNDRERRSPRSNAGKEHYRHDMKQSEPRYRDPMSVERPRQGHARDIPERMSESCYVDRHRRKADNYSSEFSAENASVPQFDRSPKIVRQSSPIPLREKSPYSMNGDRRYSSKANARGIADAEGIGHKNNGSRVQREYSIIDERVQGSHFEKPGVVDSYRVDLRHRDSPGGSSFNKPGQISCGSPSLLPPPPPFRHGIDSPLVMASSEDDSRGPGGDRRSNNRFRRYGDSNNIGRGHATTAWKGVPSWPSAGPNGFIPFHHGPPSTGFQTLAHQFPTPLFGVRPSMELNHMSAPWHDPARQFGWQNPPDDSCPPNLHGWDMSNGVFGEESHMYGRPDWDSGRHLMNSRGWEMNSDSWKTQNGNISMEFPGFQKEIDYATKVSTTETWGAGQQAGLRTRNERSRPGRLPAESIEIKTSYGDPPVKVGHGIRSIQKMSPDEPKSKDDDDISLLSGYLSKIDISMTLTSPELYKQCMDIIGKDKMAGEQKSTKMYWKDPRSGAKASISRFGGILPAHTDDVFKRCMALYKKQVETEVEKHHGTSDKVATSAGRDSSEHAADVPRSASLEHTRVSACSSSDEQCHVNSGGILFSDGVQAYEALMPGSNERELTLSRIPNSPENTH